jgi:hypothetical protein
MTRATRLSANAGSAEMQIKNPKKNSSADRTKGPCQPNIESHNKGGDNSQWRLVFQNSLAEMHPVML